MPQAAQNAMSEVRRPERVVYGQDKPWPARPRQHRSLSEYEFDAYYERRLTQLEDEYWFSPDDQTPALVLSS